MYCVKCGVQLADTENKCPLCQTVVYHPNVTRPDAKELYPKGKMPKVKSGRAFICGAALIPFMIPLIVTFFSDLQHGGRLDWFGYVAGAIILSYLIVALPLWFKKPNPVIFVPIDFAAALLYLFYINLATHGNWFWQFAFPVGIGTAVLVCTQVTLLRYLRRGKLYVVGGVVIALGCLMLMIEYLMDAAFSLPFKGWSLYPLTSLVLVGTLLIYLAMNSTAREKIERKIFF